MAAWRESAACRGEDPELWFPDGYGLAFLPQIEEAKAVCRACPVRALCLNEALDVPHKYGIWGGTDEEERRTMRRRRQRRASAERTRAVAS